MALSAAGKMAFDPSAELCSIHVIKRLAAFGNTMLPGQMTYRTVFFDGTNDESYQKALREMMRHSHSQGISLIPRMVYSLRIQSIVDLLQKCRAGLCIIGIRNKTEWWKHPFSLPVTQRIINLAPCPVLAINSYSIHGEYYAGSN